MRAFRNGKREFIANETVYIIYESSISFGQIDTYNGYDIYTVDLFDITDKEEAGKYSFKCEYLDKNSMDKLVENKILVPRKNIKNYSKSIFCDSPKYLRINKKDIFRSGYEARDELKRRTDEKNAEIERRSKMTEYELCREDNELLLKMVGLSDSEIQKYMELIDCSNKFPPMEEIVLRRFGSEIQWKDGEKWKTFIKLKSQPEEKHSEKYYVDVYHIWDLDHEPVFRGYTDESPESIFQKYSDYTEYVVSIANKRWKIENGLKTPCGYKGCVITDENGKLQPVLVTEYLTKHGSFEILNGELRHFDISIDYKHKINTFWISVYSKTSLEDHEIREWFSKRIGKFEELFKKKIEELDIKKY